MMCGPHAMPFYNLSKRERERRTRERKNILKINGRCFCSGAEERINDSILLLPFFAGRGKFIETSSL
jgi:hypothetical protein